MKSFVVISIIDSNKKHSRMKKRLNLVEERFWSDLIVDVWPTTYKVLLLFNFKYNEFYIVLKPVLERCDPSQVANVVIAETPILEDRGSESDSGPYTSISTLWDNVLLLGTEGGELITAQRSTVDDPFLITLTR